MQFLEIGKAHQRIIREKKSLKIDNDLFSNIEKNFDLDIKKSFIKEIDYKTAKKIILEYEWLGTMGTTQHHFGIYFNDNLAGVVCYGYFQAMNTNKGGHPYAPIVGSKFAKNGIQLTRGACVHWAHKHSGSRIIGKSLKLMNQKGYKYVIAFSDPEAGEIGTLYQATNWHYLGFSNTKHHDIYFKDGKIYLNDRDFFKKYKTRSKKFMENFIKDKDYLEIRLRNPKGRYIKLIGNKKENREMMNCLKPHIQSYPKRKNG